MKFSGLILAGLLVLGAAAASAADQRSGVLLDNLDRSVRPQDDLYRFVNGTLVANMEIPADRALYGTFNQLQDRVELRLREIVEDAAAQRFAPEGSDTQLLGSLYASFMNQAAAERRGVKPLRDELDLIKLITTRRELVEYFGRAQRFPDSRELTPFGKNDYRFRAPLVLTVAPDAKRPTVYTLYVDQSGLGMPDRDYYLAENGRLSEIRARYLSYATALLTLTGSDDPAKAAAEVLALETRLAAAQWNKVDLRDVAKVYNPHTVAAARARTPSFDWAAFLAAAGVRNHDHLILGQPTYFVTMAEAIEQVPVETWKNFLRLRLVDDFAPLLDTRTAMLSFDFRERVISGAPQIRPRWKRGLQLVNESIGELLGKAYVERHFSPEAKRHADEMVANIVVAFDQAITDLDWMGDSTRAAAREKLRSLRTKVGYPERWRDYSTLQVHRADPVGNLFRLRIVRRTDQIARIGQTVNLDEWPLTPQSVNAYYDFMKNEIVLPAGILQPPFFDPDADDAVNYGAIGSVIGHEVSHAFDDQGRKFDASGELRDWWTEHDQSRFTSVTRRLVDQYSSFAPGDGMRLNGELTLGENIGDVSGVEIAFQAYELSLRGQPAPLLDGFTGQQRFFIGWAQAWARKYREDELRRRLLTDPHSPSEYRVNGVVRNMPQFMEAFEVQPGDRLHLPPGEQVRIW